MPTAKGNVKKTHAEVESQLFLTTLQKLFPQIHAQCFVEFTGKLKNFNAKIVMRQRFDTKVIGMKLSREWASVATEIKQGLFEHLLLRLFKRNKPAYDTSIELDLYHSFCKNLAKNAPILTQVPILLDSFQRMNATFFDNQIEQTNLVFGDATLRKMGSYNFQTDTISISTILQDRIDLLDYVMYHEMLHKKHSYHISKKQKNMAHHSAFRQEERQFPEFERMEKELHEHIMHVKRKNRGGWNWFS